MYVYINTCDVAQIHYVFFFRLFYLSQNTVSRYIREERFFSSLTWLCHVLCGLIISILIGDDFLSFFESDNVMIQEKCVRMPLALKESVSYTLYLALEIIICVVGLGIQVAIFIKQRQLEISEDPSTSRILWKHRRNVVSSMGSLLSFLAFNIYGFLTIIPGPAIINEFIFFSCHCVYFFWLNFIETLCSPTLRSSIVDTVLWRRPPQNQAQNNEPILHLQQNRDTNEENIAESAM